LEGATVACEIEFDIQRVNVSQESAQRMRDLLADKGATLRTLCSASTTLENQGDTSSSQAPPTDAQQPMPLARSTHIITTEVYVDKRPRPRRDSDEHTTASGTTLEILSDVPIT
jgi:hypothetical protein